MSKISFNDETDLLGEFESMEEDDGVLEELAMKKRERQKNFLSVVNKKKLSKYELDEVML